jgi:hypothetical protein
MMATEALTFDLVAAAEPRLKVLEADVRRAAAEHGGDTPRCANGMWYGYGSLAHYDFKARMCGLVGCERVERGAPSVLGGSEAYDVVYEHLYAILPDCLNCSCM